MAAWLNERVCHVFRPITLSLVTDPSSVQLWHQSSHTPCLQVKHIPHRGQAQQPQEECDWGRWIQQRKSQKQTTGAATPPTPPSQGARGKRRRAIGGLRPPCPPGAAPCGCRLGGVGPLPSSVLSLVLARCGWRRAGRSSSGLAALSCP